MKNRSPQRIKKINPLYLVLFLLGLIVLISVFSILRVRRWDKVHRFTAVFNASPLIIFTYDPNLRQAVILTIPSNAFFEVPYGYGNYSAGSVYRLGSLDEKRGGGNLLTKSIENTLGIVVEGYIAPKSKELINIPAMDRAEIQRIKSTYFSLRGILSLGQIISYFREMDANLSLMDKFNLWNAIRGLRIDNITLLDIADSQVLTDQKLPDGTTVKIINRELFDAFIADKFQDHLVRSENISVEIINAADRGGLASQFAGTLKNLGANIMVRTTAAKSEEYTCLVVVSQKALTESHIVKRLQRLYKCDISSNLSEKNIADIQVILGKEFMK